MKSLAILSFLLFFLNNTAQAKVYQNIKVSPYQATIDLNDYAGRPFFEVMKNVIYPAINEQAAQQTGADHLE